MDRHLLPLVLLLASAGVAAQDQDFSKVEIKVERVAGNVYMQTGAGGNVGLSVGPDGVLVVDDQSHCWCRASVPPSPPSFLGSFDETQEPSPSPRKASAAR